MEAINIATPETVIVVHNEIEKELALRVASRMGKTITVETLFEPALDKLLTELDKEDGITSISDETLALVKLAEWEVRERMK